MKIKIFAILKSVIEVDDKFKQMNELIDDYHNNPNSATAWERLGDELEATAKMAVGGLPLSGIYDIDDEAIMEW